MVAAAPVQVRHCKWHMIRCLARDPASGRWDGIRCQVAGMRSVIVLPPSSGRSRRLARAPGCEHAILLVASSVNQAVRGAAMTTAPRPLCQSGQLGKPPCAASGGSWNRSGGRISGVAEALCCSTPPDAYSWNFQINDVFASHGLLQPGNCTPTHLDGMQSLRSTSLWYAEHWAQSPAVYPPQVSSLAL
jgi:hypothetical protein